MKRARVLPLLLLVLCLSWPSSSLVVSPGAAAARRPLALADILAWRSIAAAVVSDDGKWLAYRLSPVEGDSEMVVRQVQGDKEFRFGCGDVRPARPTWPSRRIPPGWGFRCADPEGSGSAEEAEEAAAEQRLAGGPRHRQGR